MNGMLTRGPGGNFFSHPRRHIIGQHIPVVNGPGFFLARGGVVVSAWHIQRAAAREQQGR